ncbi:MAG: dinucleotide-binding protein [Actinobacteria bacterium]|nr:dinucleotide-binding protein [Actinomycetota bacterium]
MRVVTLGRGNVGGGLAELWRSAGHDVVELGREGGDATGADALLLAVPSGSIADALGSVTGLDGIPVIDATNLVRGERPGGFASLAEYVKSITGGPVAKSFSANFARIYDRLGTTRERPANVFAADDDARAVTESLIRDAGYEPVYVGDLSAARAVEDFLGILFACAGTVGPVFYRFAPPDEF